MLKVYFTFFFNLLMTANSGAWVNITLMAISKFFIAMSFQMIYLQSAELFPTTHCATGVGFASLVSNSVGVSAPYIAYSVSFSFFFCVFCSSFEKCRNL